MKAVLVFFDFDGTITTKDSLVDFMKYAVGRRSFYIGLLALSPVLTAYSFRLIPNHVAKEKLITRFLQGWSTDRFEQLVSKYVSEQLGKITRPKALAKIRWHQEQGHTVVIVSASMECCLKEWCEENGVDLIATRLEVQDGKLTGKFATRNCYGIEKVNRIREVYDLSHCDHIYAYGDSRGDKEMLALADERFYKPFRE